ncbi:YybH family protein [Actinocatenispora sera]|nr:nuclear transport factor 2 family protein [Actinocatenispora sera]
MMSATGRQLIDATSHRHGPESRNRLAETGHAGADGARAALETFYYALNQRDADVLRADWSDDPLAQLNNPLGGILRGGESITALYDRIFTGPVRVTATFRDIVEYLGDDHAVFAGREVGSWAGPDGVEVPLTIRTTRYFRYADGRWRQFHHHGSIDDPAALAAYQRAVTG